MVLGSMNKFRKSLAFTLAEVLITLGIIGIVAAMVIPSLINAYQKHVTVTRFKQTYAQITQAVKLSEAENGDLDNWEMYSPENHNYDEMVLFTKTYILPYIKYAYTCSKGDYNKNRNCRQKPIANLSNQRLDSNYKNYYAVILMNGTQLTFDPRRSYVFVLVDINGPISDPNMRGKDIFGMIIKKSNVNTYFTNDIKSSGVFLAGDGFTREQLIDSNANPISTSKYYVCSKKGSTFSGTYCGALIKLDGWKISKDYPW